MTEQEEPEDLEDEIGCDETTELEWTVLRFDERCYFLPGRDCPGWLQGGTCGRMGDTIPEDAEQEDNESWKDFLAREKRERS